ncbi:MAG: NAD(P)-dependent oxidoreductase [Chlamydiae bacterium CG10_big_fil_rev_8_21_14_0_10_35_9]|nr:MAG: NAD(P)-dependent oxidoreductase [Chlamydiae bacterium CG10_big_fil_rev_8_21_14_0_10_35_9]
MAEEQKGVILITGCTGRIGFRCAERFAEEFKIIGIDVYLVGHLPGIELVGIDLASKKNIEENLDIILERFGNKILSVIHLAAYYNFSKGHWDKYQSITIDGTKKFLEGLLKRFEIEQFIFSSSMLVHAPCKKGEKINEESPLEPKWNYPKSKVITEKLIKDLCKDIPYVILRIAGVYDDMCHSIPLAHQTQRIYEDQLEGHFFPGDLTHGSAFVHLDDLVDAIYSIIQKRKELPKELTMLMGEPSTLSYHEVQKAISQALGKEWKTYRIPKFIAKIGAWCKQHLPFLKKGFIEPWMISISDDHYELDISKAKELLNWEPKRMLKETIPKWVDFLKEEPIVWYDKNKLEHPSKIKDDE